MKKEKKFYMFSLEYGYTDVDARVAKSISSDDDYIVVTICNVTAVYDIMDEMNDVYEASFNEGGYDFPKYIFISENIDCLRNELDKLVNPQDYK